MRLTLLLSAFLAVTSAATLEKRCSLKREKISLKDGLPVAQIKVGTPPQTFNVVFDTSMSLTWIPAVQCPTKVCRQQSNLYNANSSSTAVDLHQKKVSVKYDEDVCFDARLYRDTISVAGLPVANQIFGSAYSVKGLGGESYLGGLGLGGFGADGDTDFLAPRSNSSLTKRQFAGNGGFAQNGFQSAFGQTSQQFGMVASSNGFYQKRSNDDQSDGEFIFGGVDHNVYKGKVAYFQIPTCDYGATPYWKTEIKCVKFGNKIDVKLAPKSLASFSTASSFILAPKKQADLLHAAIDAHYDEDEDVYKLECCDKIDELPDFKVDFNGHRITLPPKLYIKKDGETCTSLIRRNPDEERDWVMGGAFLNNFYHIYDLSNKQTGLAIPKNGCDAKITEL